MSLGGNIEQARLAAGFTNAAAFARKIGVSPGTLGDWEGGRYKDLRLDNLLRIAKGAGCSLESLVAGVDVDYDALRIGLTGKETESGRSQSVTPKGLSLPATERLEQPATVVVEGDPRAADLVADRSSSAVVTSHVRKLHSIKRLLDISDQLSALSRDVRSIATDAPDSPGARKESKRDHGHSGVRRAAARRSGKR